MDLSDVYHPVHSDHMEHAQANGEITDSSNIEIQSLMNPTIAALHLHLLEYRYVGELDHRKP